jgi:hypothetical protein
VVLGPRDLDLVTILDQEVIVVVAADVAYKLKKEVSSDFLTLTMMTRSACLSSIAPFRSWTWTRITPCQQMNSYGG